MNFTLDKIDIKGDRVLVKKIPFEEKIGSFYIPESVRERKLKRRADAWKAEVLRIGDMVDFKSLRGEIKTGDTIYCAPVSLDCPAFSGDNNEEYLIITQDDILAREIKEN